MSKSPLEQPIIALSESKVWRTAKLEWQLTNIHFALKPKTCLCGKYPIKELCEITNKMNGKEAIVGNCCIKQFMQEIPSNLIIQCIKRILKNLTSNMNSETLEFANFKGWLTEWEYNFYLDISLQRNLTDKQLNRKLEINNKVIKHFNK